MTDPRISLGPDVVGTAGETVLEALDNVRPIVRVGADIGPTAAKAAAALGLVLARVFPHTVIDGDADLGTNPVGGYERRRCRDQEPRRDPDARGQAHR